MFVGIDHGTTSMRFSGGGIHWKISREDARTFSYRDLDPIFSLDRIEGIGITYSMGDNFSAISPIHKIRNRGLISRSGAGKHIGGGTRVFDEILNSGIPAIVIPGLHRQSPTDLRFKAYSHQASPEKVGIAYQAAKDLGDDVVVSDVSSNTVTLLVKDGRIFGGFDACIFAPGTEHGAIDVEGIRKIDEGELTANEAFLHAGVTHTLPEKDWIPTIAMFSAMECAAMLLLDPNARVALAGTLAPKVAGEVRALLGREIHVYDEWCASDGIALITRDVFGGIDNILGLDADM